MSDVSRRPKELKKRHGVFMPRENRHSQFWKPCLPALTAVVSARSSRLCPPSLPTTQVRQHLTYGVLKKEDFKVVYVAPMKALAAEMTSAFGRRLRALGIAVRELTGDMQLSKRELEETQIVVTTPEKWDVLTRKGSEVSMAAAVRLLIIDEVHLLNDDRGPVIETLVARTLRQVETTQSMIRIVGLSATLPNYQDVARFLGVNEATGLFYFDAAYRPVPLTQHYVGVMETNIVKRNGIMNDVCFEKVAEAVRRGKQAMVSWPPDDLIVRQGWVRRVRPYCTPRKARREGAA